MQSQDYTVIIKWKNWYALEVEEEVDEGTALDRKMECREKVTTSDEHEHAPKSKKMRTSNSAVDEEKEIQYLFVTNRVTDITHDSGSKNVYNEEVSSRNSNDTGHVISSCEGGKAEITWEQIWFPMCDTHPDKKLQILQETYDSTQKSRDNSADQKPQALKLNSEPACNLKDSELCPITCRLKPMSLPRPFTIGSSAQAVHDHSYDGKGASCNVFSDDDQDRCRLKHLMFEEGHDAVVMCKGKAKMSDIKTIYEKSIDVKNVSNNVKNAHKVDTMHTEHYWLTNYERRTKKLRGATSADCGEGRALVKCPICQLTIPGDMHDADFNTQINLHVDSCIRFAK